MVVSAHVITVVFKHCEFMSKRVDIIREEVADIRVSRSDFERHFSPPPPIIIGMGFCIGCGEFRTLST